MRVYFNSSKPHPYWVRLTKLEAEMLRDGSLVAYKAMRDKLSKVKDQNDGE